MIAMPKKSNRKSNFACSTMSFNQQRIANGEVFRNFFAVVDDIDPREALKHLKDMFHGKLDSDVVTMIFTECGYNVNQALENLMALTNDCQHSSGTSVLEKFCPLSKSSNKGYSYSCDTTCLHANKFESNHVGGFPNVSNKIMRNQAQIGDQNFTSFSNLCATYEDAGSDTVSLLKEDNSSSEESQELKNQQFRTIQCTSKENLKTITSFQSEHSSATPTKSCPFSLPKPSISLNMSHVESVTPVNDKSLFHNTENVHKFIMPIAPLPPKPTLHSPSNSKLQATGEMSAAVANSMNTLGDNDYVNDNNNLEETLFSKKVNAISKKVSCGIHILIILRGLPGSGKSTLAKQLKFSGSVFSTDDYFYGNGRYVFDFTKLSEAHEWNRKRTIHALKKGVTPVIIDNTNIESWEMIPYIKLGLNYQYEIQVLEPDTPWKFKPGKLAKKNTHKVSREKIKRMLDKYEGSKYIGTLIDSYRAIYIQEGKIRPSKFYQVPKDKAFECSAGSEKSGQNGHSSKKDVIESCIQDPNNIISLEAVVHHADESDDSEMSSVNNKPIFIENVSNADHNCSESNLQSELKIGDLNDLKLLTQEDSEESHSTVSRQLPSPDSNQELSSWEAITELDKDFFWTTNQAKSDFNNFSELCSSESGSKSPNLQDIGETLSIVSLESSESSISGSSKHFENGTLGQKSKDDVHVEDTEKLHGQRSSMQDFTSTSFEICSSLYPKPQRNNLLRQTICEISGNESTAMSNSNENSIVAWEAVDDINLVESTWDDKSAVNEIFDIKKINIPKPQRLLNNNFNNEIGEKIAMDSDQSANIFYENYSKYDWQLPAFPSGFLPYDVNKKLHKVEKISRSLTYSESQTEAADFVLISKIESNPLCISNFKILVASDRSKETSLFPQSCLIEESEKIDKILYYDESTSTDDISENIELSDKVKTLRACFPQICEDDLKHFLELCHGDDSWLSNILLEWGYEYNNPTIECKYSVPNKFEKSGNSVTSDWPYVQQLDKFSSNTATQISSSATAEGSPVHQLHDSVRNTPKVACIQQLEETVLNIPKEVIGSITEDWSFEQQLDDSVLNTWEEINNFTTTDWSNIQQFDDIESNASVTENKFDIGKVSMSDNKEEKDLKDRQKHNIDNLTLTLNLTLASALEAIFGPVIDTKSGSLPSSYRHIMLDFDTAKILYDKWKKTVQSLPPIEGNIGRPSPEMNYISPANGTHGFHQASKDPLPLSEIMDMEYALQLLNEEKMRNRKCTESNIAMKLKRQKLYEMFPGVDTKALDDIFEANNFNLSQTVIILEEDIGKPAKTGKFPGQTSPPASPKPQLKQKHAPDLVIQGYSDWKHPDAFIMNEKFETVLESTISTEAASFRNEAVEHYQLRGEYMKKAHAAYYKGMSQLASFYAQKGSYHADRCKEANKTASELIVEERNTSLNSLVLDLHGLYVKEAIQLLGKFLRGKKKELTDKIYGDLQSVTVLTGRGVHSLNGAKLRPSVIKYFKSTGYKFSEIKPGIFSINLVACPES